MRTTRSLVCVDSSTDKETIDEDLDSSVDAQPAISQWWKAGPEYFCEQRYTICTQLL